MTEGDGRPETNIIARQINLIRTRIDEAARRAGRAPESIRLIAATKSVSTAQVQAAIDAGVVHLGENRLQEALQKLSIFDQRTDLTWHFIGHLQRRKVKTTLGRFHLIHSVDSVDLAEEINRQAERIGIRQSVLLEVNIGNEHSKSGFSPTELQTALSPVDAMNHLAVKGLMAIPPKTETAEEARPYFRAVRQLAMTVRELGFRRIRMDELSIGMSQDFEVAIEEGATYVRVGTAIFGVRPLPAMLRT